MKLAVDPEKAWETTREGAPLPGRQRASAASFFKSASASSARAVGTKM
jgi:hypothetical protein